jgi:hypothetical protein
MTDLRDWISERLDVDADDVQVFDTGAVSVEQSRDKGPSLWFDGDCMMSLTWGSTRIETGTGDAGDENVKRAVSLVMAAYEAFQKARPS